MNVSDATFCGITLGALLMNLEALFVISRVDSYDCDHVYSTDYSVNWHYDSKVQ